MIALYAQQALAQRTKPPRDPQAWLATVEANAGKRADLERYLLEWPTAPASAIVGWMHGDKHSMQYFERVAS